MEDETCITVDIDTEVRVRDLAKRELDVRLVPWDTIIETHAGPEMFVRGAFVEAKPNEVRLMGLEHEVHMGLGQSGQPRLARHPVGVATSLWDDDSGQFATFRVARTMRGDEVLALADEGIASGVSVEFQTIPGGSPVETIRGRKVRVHRRSRLTGASTTYQPAYADAMVVAVRSEEEAPVADEGTSIVPVDPLADIKDLIRGQGENFNRSFEGLAQRILELENQNRQDISIPRPTEESRTEVSSGQWMSYVLRMFAGERLAGDEMRLVADLITTDNLGVVPEQYLNELIGVIDPRRPFLASTRRIPLPDAGLTLNLPKLVTRPTVGTQAEEKDELSSTATSITIEDFTPVTKGGVGDLSIQLIRRSSPAFLSLYLELLAEAYAVNTEDGAVDALLASGTTSGGTLDPEALSLGAAWTNASAAIKRGPDTIWLSSEGVAAFLDAKADGTNMPLYGSLQANFSIPGGIGGTIQGLRPVWVPALDDETPDVIVGPSSGFLWTEDGAFTLQVDVPSKAGRDVAIVGMIWYMPIYPAAFTVYNIAS